MIVGLWVTLQEKRWLRHFPVFYGQPSPSVQQGVVELLQAAGLQATLEERTVGFARVGVVVAERTRENCE